MTDGVSPFTFAKDPDEAGAEMVVIVFLGLHDRHLGDRSIWTLFHELLGTGMPPSDHDKLRLGNGPRHGADEELVEQLALRIRQWDAARRAVVRSR